MKNEAGQNASQRVRSSQRSSGCAISYQADSDLKDELEHCVGSLDVKLGHQGPWTELGN